MDLDMDAGSSASLAVLDGLRADQDSDTEQYAMFAEECQAIFQKTTERNRVLHDKNKSLMLECQELRGLLKDTTDHLGHLESSIAASLNLGDPRPLLASTLATAPSSSSSKVAVAPKLEDPIIGCFIDGDGAICHSSFIKQGRLGGSKFYDSLTAYLTQASKTVLSSASSSSSSSSSTGTVTGNGAAGSQDGVKFKIVVQVFHHRAHLSQTCVQHQVTDPRVFAEFVSGVNSADPLCAMVDMGSAAREATRRKLTGLLDLYTSLPPSSCPLVFFAGASDPLYAPILADYKHHHGNFDRLVLLKGFNEVSPEIKGISGLRIVGFPKIFLSQRPGDGTGPLPSSPPKRLRTFSDRPSVLPPKPAQGPASSTSASASASSSHSPTKATSAALTASTSGSSGGGASEEAKKIRQEVAKHFQLLPQNPAPCNWHYILGDCPRGSRCEFGHNYTITEEQLRIIKRIASQNACWSMVEIGECADPDCFYGHACPFGSGCDKRGRGCKFTNAMHT